ncbi:MAG: iron chelate uptake ABC transporter family permease subunit [Elusimicrobia bacterium]|nr:iron chelate uptake ABC transporter family permease subunit [Elusimicrobiota bacterium]
MKPPKRLRYVFVGLGLLIVLAVVAGTAFGSVDIPLRKTVMILLSRLSSFLGAANWTRIQEIILIEVRLPRVLLACTVGGGLALAGAIMQGIFRNPMADPGIIGATGGGALGAVIALYMGWAADRIYTLPAAAFLGAWTCSLLVYLLSTERGKTSMTMLLLSGIAVGGMASSLTSLVLSLSLKNAELGRQIVFWLLGGLDFKGWTHVRIAAVVILPASLVAIAFSRDLNAMLLGEEGAQNVGVDVRNAKRWLLALASLITGAAVAVSGGVAFVGLIVPHLVRLVLGPDHRSLLPASFLAGASFLTAADLLCRMAIPPEELRLGVVTAMVGGPFFLYLLLKKRGEIGC